MKWNFVKIWSWHVENHPNYHKLHFEEFHYSYHNIIVDDWKIYNFKFKKRNSFFGKKRIIHFVNVETDPRLPYT